jgi:hypothetical protein
METFYNISSSEQNSIQSLSSQILFHFGTLFAIKNKSMQDTVDIFSTERYYSKNL